MQISRRQFISILGASTLAGVAGVPLEAIALPANARKAIWLQGSGCSGCSVSFLNRIATTAPQTADRVLLDIVEVDFQPTIMAAVGELAVAAAENVYALGNYILIVEGGVPTAFGGAACWAYSKGGVDYTFLDVVKKYASKAAVIVSVGNCACFGGMSAAAPNPSGVKSVSAATGKKTVNIAGCPPHPDWIIWGLAQLIAGASVPLDSYGRPTALYGKKLHEKCPRKETDEASTFGVDNRCLKELGCRGPETKAPCATSKWNGGANWCVDANAPCIGCTEPSFPAVGLMGREADD